MSASYDRSYVQVVLLLTALLAVASCQRPFVEPALPEFELVSPDLSNVFRNATITLVVEANSFRGVERVGVNGDTLILDEDEQVWVGQYTLHGGLNPLIISVTDADDQTAYDTLYAVHGSLSLERTVPDLPEGRGGHTATYMPDSTVLVIGGASQAAGEARADAVYRPANASTFYSVADPMVAARTGHTATLLPDGRVLLLGGSRRDQADSVEDLVETVELFDSQTQTFLPVPLRGDPVRRTLHTATMHREGDRTFIDLYGGRGDISYQTPAVFGSRRDLRRFEFRNDSLIALNTAPGPDLGVAAWGHTQTKLQESNATADKRYLIAGARFSVGVDEEISFIVDYDVPVGVDQRPVEALKTNRIRHASALLQNGFVGTFGGRRGSLIEVLNEVEIYSDEAERSFSYRDDNALLRRYGLTATKLPDRRILLLGGFLPSGESTGVSAVFRTPRL